MDAPDLFCTLEKLYLISQGLDRLLEDHFTDINHDNGQLHKRSLCVRVSGIAELRLGLEALAMADPLYLATDGPEHSFPVDNGADSGYHKQDNNER